MINKAKYLCDDELKSFIAFTEAYNIQQAEIAVVTNTTRQWINTVFTSVRENKPKQYGIKKEIIRTFLNHHIERIKQDSLATQDLLETALKKEKDKLAKQLSESKAWLLKINV